MISIRQKEGEWEVWTDAGQDEFSGRCIGSSQTKSVALSLAAEELHYDCQAVRLELDKESHERKT